MLEDVGVEFSLFGLEGVALTDAVVHNFLSRFVLPVGTRAVFCSLRVSIHLNWLLLDIPAAKNTRLQILVFAILRVQILTLHLRPFLLNGLGLRVFPIDVLSHQVAISLVVMQTEFFR